MRCLPMNHAKRVMILLTLCLLCEPAAAGTKTYQMTGKVVDMDADKIVIQKQRGTAELALDEEKPLPDSIKVGSKITVRYRMTAVSAKPMGKSK